MVIVAKGGMQMQEMQDILGCRNEGWGCSRGLLLCSSNPLFCLRLVLVLASSMKDVGQAGKADEELRDAQGLSGQLP